MSTARSGGVLIAAASLVTLPVSDRPACSEPIGGAGQWIVVGVVPLTGADSVRVINPVTLAVIASIATRPHPQDVVDTPGHTRTFVLEMGSDTAPGNSIAELDLSGRRVARRIDLGRYRRPHWAQVSRDGKTMWVACVPAILEIDLPHGVIRHAWGRAGPGAWNFVVTRDERHIITANFDGGTATIIDREGPGLRTVRLSGKPLGIATSPDGREVWIGATDSDSIYVLDATADTLIARFPSDGSEPARMAFTADGTKLIVTNSRSNSVTIYDVLTRRPLFRVRTGGESPKGLVLDLLGRTAYVSLMGSGELLAIKVRTGKVLLRAKVGASPERMGWGFSQVH